MRWVIVLCCWLLPAGAMAQAHYVDPSSMTPDEEAQWATSLYVIGGAVLAVTAATSFFLAYLGVEDSLSHLFGPAPSSPDPYEGGAIAAGCIGGVVGLIMIAVAIRFDVDSGRRRPPSTPAWWPE